MPFNQSVPRCELLDVHAGYEVVAETADVTDACFAGPQQVVTYSPGRTDHPLVNFPEPRIPRYSSTRHSLGQ